MGVAEVEPPDRSTIDAAATRVAGHIRTTPVLDLEPASKLTAGAGGRITVKIESLQHTGSFKPRGAFNRVLSAMADGSIPDAGIIAASGGNHGAAVAHVATSLGVPAEIFVPEAAPAIKLDRLRSYPVQVTTAGVLYDDAQNASDPRASETGALIVHPYGMPEILAGQGTVAREFEAQVPDLDTVLVAVGGGGLIGGMAAWFRNDVSVIAVEPDRSRSMGAALDAGEPVTVDVAGVASDSLGARRVGDLPFASARRWVDDHITVTDAAITETQRTIWQELRLVAEPGGAAALAALQSGRYRPDVDERVGVLICGANADPGPLAQVQG